MDHNDTDIEKVQRKIYSKEVLNALRNSELSNLWPKSLDKTCINSHGQWDPVKSFDSIKPTDSKKNTFYENKTYRNNDKNKDDISLRPERRKWNDGCQVLNNKRNSEEIHTNSYRKSYSGAMPSNGGGDNDKCNFNRNSSRSVKLRERDNKYSNPKTDRSSRNNSNLEDRKDDSDEMKYTYKNGSNNNRNNNEPEWFSNGPENCDEIIELTGMTTSDNSINNYKKDFSRPDNIKKDEPNNTDTKDLDQLLVNFANKKPIFIDTSVNSPKREGSRFQEIFQKETEINHLKETKEVENIIKAVLSENVSKIDAEKLNNVSKPLPNGVLTVEEIERNMTTAQNDFTGTPSKCATIDTLTSFEPSLNSLLSSSVSSPSIDNSKVVNWLSNLNMSIKEPEVEHKPFYNETNGFPSMSGKIPPQSVYMQAGYSKFPSTLQHPPGLPLMLNAGNLQQQHSMQQQHQSLQQQQQTLQQQQHQTYHQQSMQQQHQQTQSLQQQQQQQSMQHRLTLQHNQTIQQALQNQKHMALVKQMSLNMQQRNPLLIANQNEDAFSSMFLPEKFKYNTQQSLPNDFHSDHNLLSNLILKNNLQMNHINDRGGMMGSAMVGPPGLPSNMAMTDKSMMMNSRPIVKTNPPQFVDYAQQMNDFSGHQQYHGNFRRPLNNNLLYLQSLEMNKPAQYSNNQGRADPLFGPSFPQGQQQPPHDGCPLQRSSSSRMLANLFSVNSGSHLPPLPQQAKYADQIETENN